MTAWLLGLLAVCAVLAAIELLRSERRLAAAESVPPFPSEPPLPVEPPMPLDPPMPMDPPMPGEPPMPLDPPMPEDELDAETMVSRVRVVMVTAGPYGLVVDCIVEEGDDYGGLGTPLTLILDDEPGVTDASVGDLRSWAEHDAVVDLTVIAAAGEPTAALRGAGTSVWLPILDVCS